MAHAVPTHAPVARASASRGRIGLVVWAFAALLYVVAVFHRMALGVAAFDVEVRLQVSPSVIGTFTAVQLGVYVVAQFPAGYLVDRIGPRWTLAISMGLMAVGETIFALAHGLPAGVAGRALVGLGDALTFVSVLHVAQAWIPARFGTLVATVTGSVGAIGQLVGTVPLRWSLTEHGWTPTFLASAGVTLLLGVIAATLLRDRPRDAPAPAGPPARPVAHFRAAIARDETRLGFWLHLGLFCPFITLSALWGFPYLVEVGGLSHAEAGGTLLILPLAFAVSGPLVGMIGGRTVRAVAGPALVLNAIVVGLWATIVAWPTGPAPHALVVAGLIASGVAASGGMLAFEVARRGADGESAASATAVANCGGFLATMACMVLTGVLIGPLGYALALTPMVVASAIGLARALRLTGRIARRTPPAVVAGRG